ncbi:MAG TPA: hypothetical protein VFV32_09610 [Acidimicrobiales bacterium]|nr:hypothetical protein [Acidimicrobiales bacterium]
MDLPMGGVVAANIAFWALVHTATGFYVHGLPPERLDRDGWLHRPLRVEAGGRLYERLRIRRWKDRLPEAGALFAGGVSKRHLPSAAVGGLGRFVVETRRAELGHWLALVPGPLAVLWNPPVGAAAMVAYGVLVNLPFIAVQRFNRQRAQRVLERSNGSRSDGPRRR